MYKAITIDKTIARYVLVELGSARENYAPMTSAHEAYAVILEELDEFWEEVRKKHGNSADMQKELIQVAAMAFRALGDLHLVRGRDSNS